MGLYDFLSSSVPVIAYCATHQSSRSVAEEEYVKTMNELHVRVRSESASIATGYEKAILEARSREVESMRGALSQFLQTPLQSDEAELRRIMADSLERITRQVNDGGVPGLRMSVEGRLYFPALRKATERRLLAQGKSYLEELGFSLSKGAGEIYESMFVVEGGRNLDVLEHIVRDRMGIYSTTHGKHIKEFDGYSYTAYNLVHARGEFPSGEMLATFTEMTFSFSKPDLKYAPFRNALEKILDQLAVDTGLPLFSLWQRKLGLGKGEEFALRLASNSPDQLGDCVQWLASLKENTRVRDAIVAKGKLVVKEYLF